MTYIKKLLILVSIFLISCNNKNSSSSKETHSENYNLEFQKNFKNKPKIFSAFWIDMNERDFNRVVDTLIKQRKISQTEDSLFYDLDGFSMYFKETFENNKLRKITLLAKLEPLLATQEYSPYNLFYTKYNLPALVQKDKYYQKQTVPNSDSDPVHYVYLNNGAPENVPSSLIDNGVKKYNYQQNKGEKTTRFGLAKKIELNKDARTKIIINEVPSQDEEINKDLVYSLEDWENYLPSRIKNKFRIGRSEMGLFAGDYKNFKDQKTRETIGNYLIRKNSKYVTYCYFQNYDLKITYVDKYYYEDEIRRQNNSENSKTEFKKEMEELNRKARIQSKEEALEDI
jgi:hypothetical protein